MISKKNSNSNEVVVNNKTNFKCHLVKCQDIMDNIHFDQVVIKAMGKATTRAINLALQLNLNNYNTFELSTRTYSVDILEDKVKRKIIGAEKDVFDPDEVDVKLSKKITHVPAIEIIVRKSKLELDKLNHARKQAKNMKAGKSI